MWRLKALALTILPVPVFLKRLAAPRCVFSFGISLVSLRFFSRGRVAAVSLGTRRALATRELTQDDVHLIAFLPRRCFRERHFTQFSDQPLEDPAPNLRVRRLSSPGADRSCLLASV